MSEEDEDVTGDEKPEASTRMWVVLGALFILGTAVVIGAWCYYRHLLNCHLADNVELETYGARVRDLRAYQGTLGDSFGAFSALFAGLGVMVSGIAFVGFIYALKMQRDDLNLQREEMRRTRKQIKRQADISKGQLEMATQQMLSSALPSYVELLNRVFEKVDYEQSDLETASHFFANIVSRCNEFFPGVQKSKDYCHDVFHTLHVIAFRLAKIRPWLNVLFMWNKKILALELEQDEKIDYMQQMLKCCTMVERQMYWLAEVKQLNVNYYNIGELDALAGRLQIPRHYEQIDNVRCRLFIVCELLRKVDFPHRIDNRTEHKQPFVKQVNQVAERARAIYINSYPFLRSA